MSRKPPGPGADPARTVAAAVACVRERTPLEPWLGVTLGSGLGGVIDAIEDAVVLHTREIPHWPAATVAGHAGRLALGRWRGVPVVALAGRSHRYEGHTLEQITLPVRVLVALGARALVFTNAVGGIRSDLAPGDVMVATSLINFIGRRGLFSPAEASARGRARAAADPCSPRLRAALLEAARAARVPLAQGVLMASHGPSYETAAEIRMAAALGADVAGMSTVYEVSLAAELGCEAASLSCITNRATGLSAAPLTHADVTHVADRAAGRMRAILEELLASHASGAGTAIGDGISAGPRPTK